MLKGINVGGRRIVRMDELKAVYISLGMKNVRTYIQSGNVLFESDSLKTEGLKSTIERSLEDKFGFRVSVIIRTADEMENIIVQCPFDNIDMKNDGSKIAVIFLSSVSDQNVLLELKNYIKPGEKLIPGSREIYLSCPEGFGKTKLTNQPVEQRLKVTATSRNWRSVNKMYELLNNKF